MKFLPKIFRQKKNGSSVQQPLEQAKQVNPPILNALVFMVDWPIFQPIFSVFEQEKVPLYFIHKGRGTATSEFTDLLGIGATEKAVILCIEQPVRIPVLMTEIRKKIGVNRPGAGVAFTIPLSAINNPILRAFSPVEEPDRVDRRSGGFPNALIYSVINRGYSDEFMNTARKAGASGGTVLSARYKALDGAVKFFGISVQEEREIIFILTSKGKKDAIMQAVSTAHGLDSKAQGLIFSLPVDRAMSLSFVQEFNT